MSNIPKTPDLSKTIADLARRLAALEKSPTTSAGTKLLHADWFNFSTQAPTGNYVDVTNGVSGAGSSGVATFKAVRPIPLLIVGGFEMASNTGTGGFLYGRLIIRVAGGGAVVGTSQNIIAWVSATGVYYPFVFANVIPAYGSGGVQGGAPVLTNGVTYEAALQMHSDNPPITSVQTGALSLDVYSLGG